MTPNLLNQTILLCQWIAETPHIRGSINGMAAQVLQEAVSEHNAETLQPPDQKDAKLDYCYRKLMDTFIKPIMTKAEWLAAIDEDMANVQPAGHMPDAGGMAQPVALPKGALIMQARLIEVEDKLAELEIISQKMALDIECLLLDPTSTFWYDKGHNTLQQHRDLMDKWYPQDHISPLGMD